MSPCSCRTGSAVIGPPSPSMVTGFAGHQPVLGHDRRIVAAGRRREAIAEFIVQRRAGRFVEIDVDAPAALDEQRAQIVDAVGMVGVLVRVEYAVDPIDLGVEKLLAQIRRRIDQHARDAAFAFPFNQDRGAAAPVFRICRIAIAPAQSRPGHAAGRAAAENGDFQRHLAFRQRRLRGGALWRTGGRNSPWSAARFRRA